MLKCVSLSNQCDIPHNDIVCDITPLQNFFFDITPVLNKAYVGRFTLSCGVFMHGRCQLIKTFVNKNVTCYFSPIPCLSGSGDPPPPLVILLYSTPDSIITVLL